jgi:hypothetical protein
LTAFVADRVAYEMTISHAEFFRTLPAALNNAAYKLRGSEAVIEVKGKRLTILLSPESTRRFGPIPLPVTHIELEFDGYSREEREKFLAHFNNCYRRGGG